MFDEFARAIGFLCALCGGSRRPRRSKVLSDLAKQQNLKSQRTLRTAAEAAEIGSPLLQDDLLAFLQPAENFGLGAVRNADVDGDFFHPVLGFGVRNID